MVTGAIRGFARLLLVLTAASAARAGTVELAWTAVPGATGYRVYYGTASGRYTASKDVGSATGTALTNLTDCISYYAAVKAYNAAGESAQFSNEISGWSRPAVDAPSPAAEHQGRRFTLQVRGANFHPGATVLVDNPRVRLESATVVDCGRIDLVVAVDPEGPGVRPAQAGAFTVTVQNADGTFGARAGAFEVLVDPARFDVNRSTSSTLGRVDGADTVWMARLFSGQDGIDALYDPDFDLDGNGWIDGDDVAYLAANLGKCWSGTAWTIEACSGPAR
jgi:hypothetical protein